MSDTRPVVRSLHKKVILYSIMIRLASITHVGCKSIDTTRVRKCSKQFERFKIAFVNKTQQ